MEGTKGQSQEIQTSSYFTTDPNLDKCKHTILSETLQHWAEHSSNSLLFRPRMRYENTFLISPAHVEN